MNHRLPTSLRRAWYWPILALLSCDYTFVTYITVSVESREIPVTGAWVLACGHAAKTDKVGIAKIERADFLGGPCQTPVIVLAPGFRPSVTFMENGGSRAVVSDVKGCGTPDGVEEAWTVHVRPTPAASGAGMLTTCDEAGYCAIIAPDLTPGRASLSLLVEPSGGDGTQDQAEPRILAANSITHSAMGTGGLRISFELPTDLPAGTRITPMVSWFHNAPSHATSRDGTPYTMDSHLMRDGVATFADPVIFGE